MSLTKLPMVDKPIWKEVRWIGKEDKKIFYLCDGLACGEGHDCRECRHTSKIEHAKNFKRRKSGYIYEETSEAARQIKNSASLEEINDLP